jgi:outer membrane protein OmpA-like peptidoglycan-associated protein
MRQSALHNELSGEADPSIWPWVIACIGAAALILVSRQVLASIPASLEREALSVLAAEQQLNVKVGVSGRELSLTGVLTAGTDTDALVRRVASIDGVHSVSDSLTVFDPAAAERSRRASFGDALGRLDTSSVAFEAGSATFAAGSEVALGQLEQLLKTWPEFRIRIGGHTDNTGRPDVNLRLSRERSRAVADWLSARGVPAEQIIAKGYGATQPIADNATESGRSQNRRIEVRYVD